MADVKTCSISSTEFGKLFFEFKPRFIALAYRYVRDRETAEDLVSDSFMTFWEMHENLPADINVPAYILTSVKNRCLNHLNAQIRHRRAERDMHSTLTRRLHADVRSLSACDPDLLFSEEIRTIPQRIPVEPGQKYDIQRDRRRTGNFRQPCQFRNPPGAQPDAHRTEGLPPGRTDHPAAFVQVVG